MSRRTARRSRNGAPRIIISASRQTSRTTRTIREEFPNRRLFTSRRRRRRARRREREPTQNTRERSEFFLRDDSVTDGQTLEETRLREELESLREETRLASGARARRRMLSPPPRSDARRNPRRIARATEETERLERELAVTKTLLTEAKYKERQAVTKATNVTSELCDAPNRTHALRASTQTLETRMKLERDLSDRNGAALGAAELPLNSARDRGWTRASPWRHCAARWRERTGRCTRRWRSTPNSPKVCAPPSARGKAPRREPRAFWRIAPTTRRGSGTTTNGRTA